MKIKEELNQLKTEFKSLSKKFAELNETESKEVIGGMPDLFSVITRTRSCPFGYNEGPCMLTREVVEKRGKFVCHLCERLPEW